MTTWADVRRAVEAMPHRESCAHVHINYGSQYACNCSRSKALATLDAAEQHLREMVLKWLDDGVELTGSPPGTHTIEYDIQSVVISHENLAEFLNATETGGDAE